VRAVGVFLAIALALALQTSLARFVVRGTVALDLVLVVVVYVALTSGPVTGMFAGSIAGIVQDALSSGTVGIGGLANAIVGFASGVVGQQFIVTAPFPRFVLFVAATIAHAALFMGMYVLLGLKEFPSPWPAVLSQAVANAMVGVIGFTIIEGLPGTIERRRLSKRAKR
jgi:rod shape-determining protein MreD